jgi:hypothetical protein
MYLALVETTGQVIRVLQDTFMREGCSDAPEVFKLFQWKGTKDDDWFGRCFDDPIDRVIVVINPHGY